MRLEPFQLGPFELHAIVGSGGMGTVWRGVHRERGVPVGVKVIRTGSTGSRRFTLAFRNEVRQVAKLDHPHVVRILDHGEADAAAEARSGGRIEAGAPWFAMEYASGGSLAQHTELPVAWPDVRDALLALLSGLGHAHARGVLHRDLSPRNVLISGPADPRPGLKLADFGLARGELASDMLVEGGTPQYMPPEQFAGRASAQGPWSDLYALGCLAWELVTGSPPFVGRTARELQRLHTAAPIPPLIPRTPVPAGLEPWLLRLLQKAPADRFRFAADAIRALEALGPAEDPQPGAAGVTAELSGWSELPEEALPEPAAILPVAIPEAFPGRSPEPKHPLSGVGLGLYDLRILPLVDRQQPTRAAWDALREAWGLRRPRAIVLRGATGHGKTHIARSVAWAAHERCGAELLAVEHSPVPGPTHGLGFAVASALGVVGLAPHEMQERIEGFLELQGVEDDGEDYLVHALVRALSGQGGLPVDELDALLVRVLGWLCRDRPLVLRLEGLQWGHETARFARKLLGRDEPLPVLVLASIDAPDREEPSLSELPGVVEIEVEPLAAEDQLALVRELLDLAPALAERVVRRTRGSPLFAERLIGDWIRRDILIPTPAGYALPAGADPALPDELHQIWIHAVEQALGGLGPAARTALSVCGALGLELDRGEWIEVSRRLGVEDASRVVDELADALCARHLAEPRAAGRAGVSWPPSARTRGPDGWVLSHPLVWESLRRQARDAGDGRWEAVNRAVAETIAAGIGADRQQGRLGLHLLAAGDPEGSLAPLLDGATRCVETGDLPYASLLLDRRDEALAASEIVRDDPRWGEGRLLRVRTLVGRGALEEAAAEATALAETARRTGWTVLPEALRYLGLAQLKLGRLLEAEAMLTLAGASASGADTDEGRRTLARCDVLRGTLLRIRGSLSEAIAALETGRRRFEALGDTVGMADCASEIGHALLTLSDDLDAAGAEIERARAWYESVGSQIGVATCVNTLGDIHRRRGELAAAEEAYRWALIRFDRSGSDARLFPRLNLGMVLLQRGEIEAADRLFAEAQALIARGRRAGLLAAVRICRLPAAADRGDWAAWDADIAVCDGLPPRADADLASVLELAAVRAEARGEPGRAAAARERAAAFSLG